MSPVVWRYRPTPKGLYSTPAWMPATRLTLGSMVGRMPPSPDGMYSFSAGEKQRFRDTLSGYAPVELCWGVLAGHLHRRWTGVAFDEWPSFVQVESNSCKDTSDVTRAPVGADGGTAVVVEP
jgi:hypothetical protein